MLLVEMLTSALSFNNGLQQQLILGSDSPAYRRSCTVLGLLLEYM